MKTTMTDRRPRIVAALMLATLCALFATHVVSGAGGPVQQNPANAAQPPKKNPLLKLAEPWPSAEQLRQRKAATEALALFAGTDPIAFTLAGDFKTVNKDHDPNSTKTYPAELRHAREDGRIDAIPVTLSTRGHLRRMARTCDFVPLRVEFPKNRRKDTMFDGQSALKLVVQCAGGGDYEQYLLREYLAYRIFNLLTPHSFRARLAKVTYVDPAGKAMGMRYGMFLEDDDDVAKRMEGRAVELPRAQFKDVDPDARETMMVFNYMIGNTDFSIYALHNVIFVQMPDRRLHTVPYDFDVSGLVHPPYAIPARGLPIKTVQDRLYRGPCRAVDQVQPILANFIAKKDLVMGLVDAIADMDKMSRQEAKVFLNGFYSEIKSERNVKWLFLEGCLKAPAM